MNHRAKAMRGYSLLESTVVLSIVGILLTVAIISASGMSQNVKADTAADTVLSQLRLARMAAVTQRRNVVVTVDTTFAAPDNAQHLIFQTVPLPGDVAQPARSVAVPGGTQFVLEPGVPDTPMQFGNSESVCFAGASSGTTVMQFTPSGAFIDGNNNLLNGTIFFGVPNQPATARAVTIMGGVGNIQRFSWTGSKWIK